LFAQVNNKTFDAESIYATFFSGESLQNHDAYAVEHINKLYVEKPLGLEEDDLVPSSLIVAATIQGQKSSQPFKALFDPSSDNTFLHERCLPPGATPKVAATNTGRTIAGTFVTTRLVKMEKMVLPEFHQSRKIDLQECRVFNAECPYDIIVGRDFLRKVQMILNFESMTISAFGDTIPMKNKNFYENPFASLMEIVKNYDNYDDDEEIHSSFHNATKTILESMYEKADVDLVAEQQTHLSSEQQARLLSILQKRTKLFSGKLGHYKGKKMDLELIPGEVPVHQKPYPVPHAHQEVFKKELDRLCELSVLERVGETEWAALTFITPKKDGKVRWVSDFRELNKCIKGKIYPLPKIQDVLRRRKGYKFFTKIDISMQ
jgi:hypothetical protein